MKQPKKIILATKNSHKIIEIKHILKELNIEGVTDFSTIDDIPEIDETGSTFVENSLIKAKESWQYCKIAALADDSGLCVPALNGDPGVRSARYAGENATSEMLVHKLLQNMKNMKNEERTAYFATSITLYYRNNKNQEIIISGEGIINGKIVTTPIGTNGFGYDPIFIPDNYNKTFAQLSKNEKNSISHRALALQDFKKNFIKVFGE